jgi:signal peptidase II
VLIVLALVALGVYAFDQIAKYLIVKNIPEGDSVNVIGTFVQFHFVKNSGAAFSLGEGMTWVFSIVATAVAVFIVVYARRIHSLGWGILFGMLLGGTLGNLSDRLFREPSFGEGHVVDFVQVYDFPGIFNVADSAIVLSMALFIILTIAGVGLDGKRVSKQNAAAPVLTEADFAVRDVTGQDVTDPEAPETGTPETADRVGGVPTAGAEPPSATPSN